MAQLPMQHSDNSSDSGPIIEASEVVKIYDTGRVKVNALHGVDLKVERGEMVAIMGPSGCGKTTLLNCLSGLDSINGGVIKIAGRDLAKMSDNQKTRYRATKMGYVFQAFNLLPVLTALENVEMPLLVSGTKAREARERAREALGLVNLQEWTDHYPTELSGGQQQRVAIARSLVNQPGNSVGRRAHGEPGLGELRRDHGPPSLPEQAEQADLRTGDALRGPGRTDPSHHPDEGRSDRGLRVRSIQLAHVLAD